MHRKLGFEVLFLISSSPNIHLSKSWREKRRILCRVRWREVSCCHGSEFAMAYEIKAFLYHAGNVTLEKRSCAGNGREKNIKQAEESSYPPPPPSLFSDPSVMLLDERPTHCFICNTHWRNCILFHIVSPLSRVSCNSPACFLHVTSSKF